MRTLLRLVRPHRRTLSITLLLGLAGSAAGLAQPLAAKYVLDALSAQAGLLVPIVLLTALVLASAVINAVEAWLLQRTGERVVLTVRRRLAHRLLRLRLAELDVYQPGDLVSRATADSTLLREACTGALVNSANGAFALVGALVLMFVLDRPLFVVTVGVLITVAVLILLVLPKIRAATFRGQQAVGLLGAALDRALAAPRTVKAAGAEARETAGVGVAAELSYRAGLVDARYSALVAALSELSLQAAFLTVLGVGGALVATGSLSVPTLVAFLLYVFYLASPLAQLVTAATTLQQGRGAVKRIDEVATLAAEDDVDDPHDGKGEEADGSRAAEAPGIEFRDTRFGYPGREPVLHGISFAAPRGGQTALVGPSGAGKTTVFSLIERFYEPTAGKILLAGRDVSTVRRMELRRRVGYVEQDAPTLAGTFGENLRYAAPHASDEAVTDVLRATRLTELVARLPHGLDTDVGPRGVRLSGGERQRLAIARALLREPDVLLLDEATSQLDARNELALRDTVQRIAQRCTVLIIAHRLSTVAAADHIVLLDAGRIRATGRHDELLAADSLYRELATSQLIGS
ncbi:ABC transporter ATP-binding protein/permease [Allokutzneria sp. A3M-2-11 16]|uniref:ABC transporter ATP-binding protein n=1 Tax=Allokutzneria sp. A3M-2-11 16 TaxID=2962043 RepID=UPI0020B6D9CB|nr:ATP-binding cassette domain-containing protein [Allokutzneria sp. A3M-2-11 16]MCP3802006.1 ABC transporter ATP-binding protein/permease [Allokutzneria sp. A3M-2-11 16]